MVICFQNLDCLERMEETALRGREDRQVRQGFAALATTVPCLVYLPATDPIYPYYIHLCIICYKYYNFNRFRPLKWRVKKGRIEAGG